MSANGIRVFGVSVGGQQLVALSVPSDVPRMDLTAAERAVVELVMRGLSNAAIARVRGRSARTIANQLAAAYRKLKVGSRAELAALVRGKLRGRA